MIALLLLVLAQETATDVWSALPEVEKLVVETVAEDTSQFSVSSENPVRGYYIERRGVVLMVPVRYRAKAKLHVQQVTGEDNTTLAKGAAELRRSEIQERLKAWREEMRKQRILKEANFEKVVVNLTDAIPAIMGKLATLPTGEALTIIIEERLPTWYYPGFSLDKNPATKIVTLTVDSREEFARVYSDRKELRGNWQEQIKRTNTHRSIVSLIP